MNTYFHLLGLTLVFWSFSVFVSAFPCFAFDCRNTTYKEGAFDEPTTEFSPYDKIYVKIECRGLEDGSYKVTNNWIHAKRGIVRSGELSFALKKQQDYTMFFWFKLMQKGPLISALTNEDFHEENFGAWEAQTIINDAEASSALFTIREGE